MKLWVFITCVVLFAFLCTFGFVEYTYGHEGHGYTHTKEGFVDMVGSQLSSPECGGATRWIFKNGREICVIITEHAVHVKELKGATDERED
jgi:hypothetical protein